MPKALPGTREWVALNARYRHWAANRQQQNVLKALDVADKKALSVGERKCLERAMVQYAQFPATYNLNDEQINWGAPEEVGSFRDFFIAVYSGQMPHLKDVPFLDDDAQSFPLLTSGVLTTNKQVFMLQKIHASGKCDSPVLQAVLKNLSETAVLTRSNMKPALAN